MKSQNFEEEDNPMIKNLLFNGLMGGAGGEIAQLQGLDFTHFRLIQIYLKNYLYLQHVFNC